MHIWLVEFKSILHKANFFLTLLKTLLSNRDIHGMKTTVSNYPCSPIKFYSESSIHGMKTTFFYLWHENHYPWHENHCLFSNRVFIISIQPQGMHVGCRLETLNDHLTRHLSSLQQRRCCKVVGQNPFILASDTLWTLSGKLYNLYAYLAGGVQG